MWSHLGSSNFSLFFFSFCLSLVFSFCEILVQVQSQEPQLSCGARVQTRAQDSGFGQVTDFLCPMTQFSLSHPS